MPGNKPPLKIYANRVQAGLLALFSAPFVALSAIAMVVPDPYASGIWAPLLKQDSTRMLSMGLVATMCGAAFLTYLYWTITPSPMLFVDEIGLVFQRWPLIKRTIAWADVYTIMVIQTSTTAYFWRFGVLTLRVAIRPHSVATYGNKRQLQLTISQWMLPITVKEVVRLLRRYHKVTFSGPRTRSNGF